MQILSTSDPVDIFLIYLIVAIGSIGAVSLVSDIFGMFVDFYKKLDGGNKWLVQFFLPLVGSPCFFLAV